MQPHNAYNQHKQRALTRVDLIISFASTSLAATRNLQLCGRALT